MRMRPWSSVAMLALAACAEPQLAPPTAAVPHAAPPAVPSPPRAQAIPPAAESSRALRSVTGNGWSFEVPEAWVDAPIPGAIVAVRDTRRTGAFFTNVNLVTEPYRGDGLAYAHANVPVLQQVATVLDVRPVDVAGLPGADIESRWPKAEIPYRTLQRFTASGGKGFVFTCSAAENTFADTRPLCEKLLSTLRVTGAAP
jgi:hypothetical protein